MNRGDRFNFLAASICAAVGPAGAAFVCSTPAEITFLPRVYPAPTSSAAAAVFPWSLL